jgi:hypothetical protein
MNYARRVPWPSIVITLTPAHSSCRIQDAEAITQAAETSARTAAKQHEVAHLQQLLAQVGLRQGLGLGEVLLLHVQQLSTVRTAVYFFFSGWATCAEVNSSTCVVQATSTRDHLQQVVLQRRAAAAQLATTYTTLGTDVKKVGPEVHGTESCSGWGPDSGPHCPPCSPFLAGL